MLTIDKPNATPLPALSVAAQPPKLLDRVRAAIRVKHYSLSTERTYVHWVKRFIYFHQKRHPADMGAAEIERFLSALATELNVSASTQNQAMHALLFLYREVLGGSGTGFVPDQLSAPAAEEAGAAGASMSLTGQVKAANVRTHRLAG